MVSGVDKSRDAGWSVVKWSGVVSGVDQSRDAGWSAVECSRVVSGVDQSRDAGWRTSFLSRVDELNKLASLQCMGLHSSAGKALQR